MCLLPPCLTYANVMRVAKLAGQAAAAVSRSSWPTVLRRHRWPAMVAMSEAVVLVMSQWWIWDGGVRRISELQSSLVMNQMSWHESIDVSQLMPLSCY